MCWGWGGCCEVFIYLVVHNKTFNFSLPLKTLFHFQSVAPEGFHSLWYNRKLKIKNWFSVLAEFDASMCQEQRGCVPSKSTGGVKVILAHFTDRSLSHSLLAGLAMLCLTKFFLIQLQSESPCELEGMSTEWVLMVAEYWSVLWVRQMLRSSLSKGLSHSFASQVTQLDSHV